MNLQVVVGKPGNLGRTRRAIAVGFSMVATAPNPAFGMSPDAEGLEFESAIFQTSPALKFQNQPPVLLHIPHFLLTPPPPPLKNTAHAKLRLLPFSLRQGGLHRNVLFRDPPQRLKFSGG